MRNLLKRFLLSLSPPLKAPLNETERLVAELEETREKMACAWSRLDNAAPEYVELTVLEILVLETQYSLLNKRYRLLQGIKADSVSQKFTPGLVRAPTTCFSLEGQLQHHAFYGVLFNPTPDHSMSEPTQITSSN